MYLTDKDSPPKPQRNSNELPCINVNTTKYNRGCSSDGRAGALQASGQEFDSLHLHQFASVAQKEQQLPCKHQVGGSIPPAGTNRPR